VNKGGIVKESVGVLLGKVSFSHLVIWFLSTLGFDVLFVEGVNTMQELFFIPENMILFTIAMAVGGLIGALGWACLMKAESGADEPWKMKYVASMFATMFIAPMLAELLFGAIVQKYYPDINELIFNLALILVAFALARYVLLFFNEGLKKTVRMLKGDVKTAQEAAEEVKELVPPKTL